MPTQPPTPCSHPNCPELAEPNTSRCKKHERKPFSNKRVTRIRGGNARKWEKIRQTILKRDGYLCVACKAEGKDTAAEEIDHITPLAQGGSDNYDNLQALCKECHKRKSTQERISAIRERAKSTK